MKIVHLEKDESNISFFRDLDEMGGMELSPEYRSETDIAEDEQYDIVITNIHNPNIESVRELGDILLTYSLEDPSRVEAVDEVKGTDIQDVYEIGNEGKTFYCQMREGHEGFKQVYTVAKTLHELEQN